MSLYCNSSINNIIYQALSVAHVPSRLEPWSVVRSDGKHPDRVTIMPWKNGKPLVQDVEVS